MKKNEIRTWDQLSLKITLVKSRVSLLPFLTWKWWCKVVQYWYFFKSYESLESYSILPTLLVFQKLCAYPIPILNTLSRVLGFCSPKVTRRATVVLQMNRETASIIPRSRDYAVIKNNNICRSPVRGGGGEGTLAPLEFERNRQARQTI